MKIRSATLDDAAEMRARIDKTLGVYRNVGFKNGAWRDVGRWQKALRETDNPSTPRSSVP